MPDQQLAVIENQLGSIADRFLQVLPPSIPPQNLIQTVLVSCENNRSLQSCNVTSILRSAMSAAVLGLQCDGVTGHGYLVPFKNSATFVAGYKGYVNLAARAGWTLRGFVVREGESFEFDEANGVVHHDRQLGGEKDRPVVAAYSVARSNAFPTLCHVMSLDELLATRNRSAGWKSRKESSTWGTEFAAMCRKSPMRMLARDLPAIPLQQAQALDQQSDLGRAAYAEPDGGISTPVQTPGRTIDAGLQDGPELGPDDFRVYLKDETKHYPSAASWGESIKGFLARGTAPQVRSWWAMNEEEVLRHRDRHERLVSELVDRVLAILQD